MEFHVSLRLESDLGAIKDAIMFTLCSLLFRLSDIQLQIKNRRKRHGNYHRLNTHKNNRPVSNHRRH